MGRAKPATTFRVVILLSCWLATSALSLSFRIERVTTRERNLDVSVFRGWSPSPAAFVRKQIDDGESNVMTEEEAADHLATKAAPWLSGEDEVDRETFVAVLVVSPDDDGGGEVERREHAPTHGVVGCVDVKLRNHPSAGGRISHDHPTLRPHWDVSNLLVHADLRRRGVGAELLSAVTEHAQRSKTDDLAAGMVTLDVCEENAGAIGLYEREGFVSRRRGTSGGFMMKDLR